MGEGWRKDWYFAGIDTLWKSRITTLIISVNEEDVDSRICGYGLEGCRNSSHT